MLAITNVQIWTMAGEKLSGGVLINDAGRIEQVGDINLPDGCPVVDGAGRILMPGFIDAHGHAGIGEEAIGFEGRDYNEAVDPVTPHLRAIDGINPLDEGISEALAGGVTAMCIVPGSANVIGGAGVIMHMYGNTVQEMVIREPAGLKVAFGENPKRVYSAQKKSPVTRMATAALLRENLVKGQNYLAKKEAAQKDPEKPFERDLKMEVMARVLKKEIPLRAHAHRADDIMTALRIAEEFDVDIVIEHGTEAHKIINELKQYNVPLVVGPTMTTRSKVELKDRTFETLAQLSQAGLLFALTMDHPVIHVQYLPIAAALAVKAGLAEDEALKALTIYPAKILKIDQDYGSIQSGKVADLVLWDGHPLDIRSQVEQVFVKGSSVFARR